MLLVPSKVSAVAGDTLFIARLAKGAAFQGAVAGNIMTGAAAKRIMNLPSSHKRSSRGAMAALAI